MDWLKSKVDPGIWQKLLRDIDAREASGTVSLGNKIIVSGSIRITGHGDKPPVQDPLTCS